tara:strand:+ start:440 stop:985 length:546 start_codon:yes stop_codon:yes gene_type:complete
MKILFLDRDGVINIDKKYVYQWKNFQFVKGSIKALQYFTLKSIKIIIVTNQAGIAKGYYTEDDFFKLKAKFLKFCLSNNIDILDIFYCPHHKNGIVKRFAKDCQCRKPNPGMFYKAKLLHNVSLKDSVMVGDQLTDIEASVRAGIKNNFLISNEKVKSTKNFVVCDNLLNISEKIYQILKG